MSSAPGVVRVDQVGVAGVAIAHDVAGVSGQHTTGLDVVGAAPAGVHHGQKRSGCDMHVFQTARGAARALVNVGPSSWAARCRTLPTSHKAGGDPTPSIDRIRCVARATGR
jgi:hypothetical protein